jgi:DNA primase
MATWVEFAAIKRAVRLAPVLEHYQVTGLHRSGQEQYRGRCPIHSGDGEDAFQVNLAKQVFHCFYCGAGGTVLDFVAAMERCGLRQAALQLTSWFGVPACAAQPLSRPAEMRQLVTEKRSEPLPLGFALRGIDHRHRYLTAREIAEQTAITFGVGFYAGPGLLHGRLVIPIHNQASQLLGYCGRSLDGSQPRYKFPAGFQKSQVLFNLQRAAARGEPAVIVVEGFFDCMKIHQAGFCSVVALMGAAVSVRQQELLKCHFREVILMLDGDETGRRASASIATRLKAQCSLRLIELPPGTQPDQLAAPVIQAILKREE